MLAFDSQLPSEIEVVESCQYLLRAAWLNAQRTAIEDATSQLSRGVFGYKHFAISLLYSKRMVASMTTANRPADGRTDNEGCHGQR